MQKKHGVNNTKQTQQLLSKPDRKEKNQHKEEPQLLYAMSGHVSQTTAFETQTAILIRMVNNNYYNISNNRNKAISMLN